jgi:hypothetical protein
MARSVRPVEAYVLAGQFDPRRDAELGEGPAARSPLPHAMTAPESAERVAARTVVL